MSRDIPPARPRYHARVVLKAGAHASLLVRTLAVEANSDEGPTTLQVEALRGGRLRLTFTAPRLSLLRATLKAYLQWAACSLQVCRQTDTPLGAPGAI